MNKNDKRTDIKVKRDIIRLWWNTNFLYMVNRKGNLLDVYLEVGKRLVGKDRDQTERSLGWKSVEKRTSGHGVWGTGKRFFEDVS